MAKSAVTELGQCFSLSKIKSTMKGRGLGMTQAF